MTLELNDVGQRLFAMSFDPYQCIERRWGAGADELASCRDSDTKLRWYKAEQIFRNQTDAGFVLHQEVSLPSAEKLAAEQAAAVGDAAALMHGGEKTDVRLLLDPAPVAAAQ